MGLSFALGAGALLSGAVGAYTALNAPEPPSLAPPPPPPNYYQYDENGNLLVVQEWDPERNAYVTKYDPEPDPSDKEAHDAWLERQKAREEEAKAKEELKARLLSNLNQTPEDRIKAYEEYAQTLSDTMHRDVDKQYNKAVRSTEESMAARGLFGSKAYVDTLSNLRDEKARTDADIANKAALAKEELAAQDKNYWASLLNQLEAGARADEVMRLEQAGNAYRNVQLANAAQMGAYNAANLNAMMDWQARMDRNTLLSNQLLDTSTGLAYLYGFRSTSPKSKTGSPGLGTSGLQYLYSRPQRRTTPFF